MRATLAAALAATALAGCSLDRLDHLGRAPSMSPLGYPKHAIDPRVAMNPAYDAYGRAPSSPMHDPRAGLGLTPRPGQGHLGAGHGGGNYGGAGRLAAQGQSLTHGAAPQGGYVEMRTADGRAIAVRRPHPETARAASLWSSSPQSLFGDRRARGVGDILTVVIEIDDEAQIANATNRSRGGSEEMGVSTIFGFENTIEKILPDGGGLDPGVAAESSSSSSGRGQVQRNEEISLRIAATVVDVLPNGHFVVTGNQEVRVNYELRDLQIAGIIRPEDISRRNEITYDKMANARISYGGRGQITDLQQPRYGQQVIDIIAPF